MTVKMADKDKQVNKWISYEVTLILSFSVAGLRWNCKQDISQLRWKKYLASLSTMCIYLQTNPATARALRISQVNIKATQLQAHVLGSSVAKAVLMNTIKNKQKHTGNF